MASSPCFRSLGSPGDDLARIYEAFLLIRRGLRFALRPVAAVHQLRCARHAGDSIAVRPLVVVPPSGEGPAELDRWLRQLVDALAPERTRQQASPDLDPILTVIVPDWLDPTRSNELREIGAHLISAPADATPADLACLLWPDLFSGPSAGVLAALPTYLSSRVRLALASGVAICADGALTEQDMALGCGCGSDLQRFRSQFVAAGLEAPSSWIPHLAEMARSPDSRDLLARALERCSAEPHPHQPPPSMPPLPERDPLNVRAHLAERDPLNVRAHLAELHQAAVGKARLLRVPSSDVENVAQEALRKVLCGKPNVSPLQVTAALIRCTVESIVKDRWRVATRSIHLQANALDDCDQAPDPSPLPDQLHEESLVRSAFMRALHSLPEPARTTVWLALDRDWCHADIALLLGKPPGAIATTVCRSMPVVREALAPFRQSWT